MNRILAVCAAIACLTVFAWARPEPNAFLNKIANSQKELVSMVRNDAEVRDRYTRHFAMTVDEVAEYFATLRLTTAKEDTLYTVYAAPDSGILRSKQLKVKKGTKLWVDKNGRAILLWHCGNPLTRGPRSPVAKNGVEVEAGGESGDLTEVPLTTPDSMLQTVQLDISEPGVPNVPFVSVTPGESDIQIAPIFGGGNNNFLGWLGIIPGIVLSSGHTNPVPEPGTLVALGLGAMAFARRKRRD